MENIKNVKIGTVGQNKQIERIESSIFCSKYSKVQYLLQNGKICFVNYHKITDWFKLTTLKL